VKKLSSLLMLSAFFILINLHACAPQIPPQALQLSEQSLKYRQIQTRYFDAPESMVLSASAAVLQDLGYNIDESTTSLGVIVCSKQRDAHEAGQVVASVVMAALFGVATPVDKDQLIRVSLVTNPVYINEEAKDNKYRTAVRVTFQRIITNTQGQISRREGIMIEDIYKEFFDKLAQSLFLEAHEI